MLEQGVIGATMFERIGEDWVGHIITDGAVIQMPEIGIEIPLPEFYDGVKLSALPADDD